jgi:hypothetical protein
VAAAAPGSCLDSGSADLNGGEGSPFSGTPTVMEPIHLSSVHSRKIHSLQRLTKTAQMLGRSFQSQLTRRETLGTKIQTVSDNRALSPSTWFMRGAGLCSTQPDSEEKVAQRPWRFGWLAALASLPPMIGQRDPADRPASTPPSFRPPRANAIVLSHPVPATSTLALNAGNRARRPPHSFSFRTGFIVCHLAVRPTAAHSIAVSDVHATQAYNP